MALSVQGEVGVIVSILQLFFANNPTAEEVETFLVALLPAYAAISAGSSATIPAFRVGNSTVGPIPIAPVSA
jgi:hypothetical protein